MGGMPYCDACDRNWTPTSMRADGTCPTCGQELELAKPLPAAAAAAVEPADGEARHAGAPWHFKVLLLVLVIYLAWRAVQGVEWVAQHI